MNSKKTKGAQKIAEVALKIEGRNTGRLTTKEQNFILNNHTVLTAEQIAQKLNRRIESIEIFLQKKVAHLPPVKVPEEDRELSEQLHNKVYWKSVNEQFTKKEVIDFEIYWLGYIKQFNNDVEFSEEMQIVDLIKLIILADRNMFERSKARIELELLQDLHAKFKEKNGQPPYEAPMLQMQEASLATQVKACEGVYKNYTSELSILLQKKQQYEEELKATRKQRVEHLKNAKKDWVKLIKDMADEKKREREGRELALMNLATEKERARLSEIHIYQDGLGDRCLLNDETVGEDKEGENETSDSEGTN